MYLVRQKLTGNKSKAHHWTGTDTICRMASTNGLRIERYIVVVELPPNRNVCLLCQSLLNKNGYDHYFVKPAF